LKDNEALEIINKYGTSTIVIGPGVVNLVCATIRFLDNAVASSSQYIQILYNDGRIENFEGPLLKFLLPEHKNITVISW